MIFFNTQHVAFEAYFFSLRVGWQKRDWDSFSLERLECTPKATRPTHARAYTTKSACF
jgi:hypothetical protein